MNTDVNNVGQQLKPMGNHLETFRGTHEVLLRFDLSRVTGEVEKAYLTLHTSWVSGTKGGLTHGVVYYTDDNSWSEAHLDWMSRPERTRKMATFLVSEGMW